MSLSWNVFASCKLYSILQDNLILKMLNFLSKANSVSTYKNYRLSIHNVTVMFNFSIYWREYFRDSGDISSSIYIYLNWQRKADDYTCIIYVAIFNLSWILMLTQVTNCFEIMTTIVTKKVCKHGQIRDISYLDRKCEKSRKIHKKIFG